MWNPLTKKKSLGHQFFGYQSRVHIEQPNASMIFQTNLEYTLTHLYDRNQPLVVVCIGTDRSTGDSLGPLVGTKLQNMVLPNTTVYGNLDFPVHAVNLQDTITQITASHHNPFIIAVDACLGRTESVGFISVKKGPLQPGTGVNKNLPAIGELQIIGIVNVGGFMEYMVLQNTRLSLVMKMADTISQGIGNVIQSFFLIGRPADSYPPLFEPVPQ